MASIDIKTASGAVRGEHAGGVAAFLGIPYAAAPVGRLRFKPPQTHSTWEGIRDATRFGPASPQPVADPKHPADVMQFLTGSPQLVQNEDNCLTLNVWTPDASGKRPVLVWIHGSGWMSGSSQWPGYGGGVLATHEDIVVVTANNRLGPLGFLYLPGVSEGNMGLLDSVAVLRWVQENIAAFGGDPDRVTVAGQSGGGVTAVAFMASPLTKGLFRRAFAQSGPIGLPLQTPDRAVKMAEAYLRILKLNPDQTDALFSLPSDKLIAAYLKLVSQEGARQVSAPAPPMHLVGGTEVLPGPIVPAVTGGAGGDVDLLIGTTSEEMNPFVEMNPDAAHISQEMAENLISTLAPKAEARVVYRHYLARRPGGTPANIIADVTSDLMIKLPALEIAEARAKQGLPAFVYEVGWRSPQLGSCHTLDIPFLLDTLPEWASSPIFKNVDLKAVESIGRAYRQAAVAFIRTGNPNSESSINWPAYVLPQRATMRFDTLTFPMGDPAAGERQLLGMSN